MNDQLGEGINGDIFRGMDILHVAVYKKDKVIEQFLHNVVEGAFVPIQVTAVATGTVIHRSSSLLVFHLLYNETAGNPNRR